MSTQNTVVAVAEKTPKSFVRTLVDGAGNRLQFIAVVAKGGAGSFYVIHQVPAKLTNKKGEQVDGFKTKARGATVSHPTFQAAIKAVEDAFESTASSKSGWVKPAGPKGFVAKPDAFGLDNLPKAVKK